MSKRFTVIFFIFAFLSVTLKYQAQTVTVSLDTYGVTPYMVSLSTTDIYDYTYTGLHNVGVGTKTFLIATIKGKKFTAPAYTLSRKPSGSTAVMGTTKDVQNDSTQVVFFTPDLPGTYNVTVTDGVYTATVVINSAKYLGYQNTVVNGVDTKLSCNTCHSATVTSWQKTNHATMFTRAMSATPGLSGPTDHYSANCVKCHTTGYDANTTAKNDGFDDLGFVYPTVITSTTYNTLLTQYPDAMKRANIQCESCHGPASGHLGTTSDERISVTYSPDVCAYCHESGTNHIIAREFRTAIHAAPVNESGSGREACVQCHTGKGFQQYVDGVSTTDPYFDSQYYPITCAGCHDPHNPSSLYPARDDAGNDAGHQLRKLSVQLLSPNSTTPTTPNKFDVTGAGLGALCMNCHQSRTEANQALASTISSRFGPHHGPQGDILYGNNMLELGGVKLAKSNHFGATGDACVTCHMYNLNRIDANGKLIESGGHTFGMSTYQKDASGNYLRDASGARIPGVDNMAACAQCHGSTFGTSFDQAIFYLKTNGESGGNGDLDGDGVTNGLQVEVKGMIAKIMAQMPKTSSGAITPSSSWTKTQLSAYWNALTAQEDRSNGIHNPKYVVTALWGAMKSLGLSIPTGIDKSEETIPTDYVVYQNYPNPFNPSTMIKFALPKDSHVKLTIYDATGREVTTLVNDQLSAGMHNISWNAKNLASGLYIYRIEADNFVKASKMILMK